ncbi:hypothetical protein [Mesorhizobium sp. M0058]|uniref:hypothetical protein n=1 Tax=Mesorhizobium sp. M0058 TaxID=2956865 RepID=UPI003335EED9
MHKAPGTDTNHWHCSIEELRDLEAATKAEGKRLGKAGLEGVYSKSVKTYQVKQGSRFSGSYRIYTK